MRLFEILLLSLNIILLFSLFFLRKIKSQIFLIVNIVNIGLLVSHLFLEGYRWQLFLSYAMTIFFFIVSIYWHRNKSGGYKLLKRLLKAGIFSLLIIINLLSIVLSVFLPVFKVPEPTGSFAVGTRTLYFIDENRDEIFTEDDSDKRELVVQVWYPAQNIDDKQLAPYIPNCVKTLKGIAKNENIPELLVDYIKYVKSNSYEDADISSSCASYPLIILCHGMGTSRFLHTSQAENLASNGYIVVAIDHTYSTMVTVFPDGEVTNYITEFVNETNAAGMEISRDVVGTVWAEDVKFIIDQFEIMNSANSQSEFSGKITIDKIGIFGHSFGGATAFNAYYTDDRIKAGIDMDGSLSNLDGYSLDDTAILSRPFMFLMSDQQIQIRRKYANPSDEDLLALNITREQYEEDAKDFIFENKLMESTTKNGGYTIYIDSMLHFNFTDMQLYSPIIPLTGMTGKINGSRGALLINQYTVAFFDKYLKSAEGDLLEGVDDEYPEVYFEYYYE